MQDKKGKPSKIVISQEDYIKLVSIFQTIKRDLNLYFKIIGQDNERPIFQVKDKSLFAVLKINGIDYDTIE